MAISRFSSNDYPKLGVFQIVANQSRKLDICRSLNEGGRTAPCFRRFPQREKYQLCPDGKQNRKYRWHKRLAWLEHSTTIRIQVCRTGFGRIGQAATRRDRSGAVFQGGLQSTSQIDLGTAYSRSHWLPN